MNQDLKQRLIGAVVVTALAAIFIPMLFDDPIDKGGQLVTELEIPSPNTATDENLSSKLPKTAKQVLENPEPTSEIINTSEEAELSQETQPPAEANQEDQPEDTAQATAESGSGLDTGLVDEKNNIVQTQTKAPEATSVVVAPPQVAPAKKLAVTQPPVAVKKELPAKTVVTEQIQTQAPATKSEAIGRWTIQAGSFSKKENAVTLMETLKKQGLPASIDTVNGPNNSVLYRLKVGPTLDKKRALDMKAKVDNQKIQSLLIAE
ncbi:MAG: SPOR domain-containing protein [Methylococcales bacterium]|nr:SPOR domain-containing protein [Methylococcales bacterium]